MTSLRDIIRPYDAESDRYRRACDMSMGEYLRGEACGLSVADLMATLDFGLYMAAHHDPYARYPQWAREMARGVRRALRRTWDDEVARRASAKADAAVILIADEIGRQLNDALVRRHESLSRELYRQLDPDKTGDRQ